ncbi:MAG: type II toxin-antitoxin system HicA family toxin [Gammaproteobacteria bacterium]|nr:type II toxin-antitoxin system HicA family toxin [Gammaproteobacteria bacterium]
MLKEWTINYRQPGTSHVTFRFPNGAKVTVPSHKPIKPVYIKQFLELLDEGGFLDG